MLAPHQTKLAITEKILSPNEGPRIAILILEWFQLPNAKRLDTGIEMTAKRAYGGRRPVFSIGVESHQTWLPAAVITIFFGVVHTDSFNGQRPGRAQGRLQGPDGLRVLPPRLGGASGVNLIQNEFTNVVGFRANNDASNIYCSKTAGRLQPSDVSFSICSAQRPLHTRQR